MKTGIDLVDDIYQLLNIPAIVNQISGKIYKHRIPAGMLTKVNVRIGSLTVTGEQFQDGIININIQAPDLFDNTGNSNNIGTPNAKEINRVTKIILPYLNNASANGSGLDVLDIDLIEDFESESHYNNIRVRMRTPNY